MRLKGINKNINEQIEILHEILKQNKKLYSILKILQDSNLKDYYVAAGCVNQTVFNYYHDYNMTYGIKDYDIVYFDEDTSYYKEDETIKYIGSLIKDIDVTFDVKNQARVHLWYKEKFEYEIAPYTSTEESISRWGATITCIGVRLENDKLIVYAPYGLNDLFEMIIRPVKLDFKKEKYEERSKVLNNKWPKLKIIPWEY